MVRGWRSGGTRSVFNRFTNIGYRHAVTRPPAQAMIYCGNAIYSSKKYQTVHFENNEHWYIDSSSSPCRILSASILKFNLVTEFRISHEWIAHSNSDRWVDGVATDKRILGQRSCVNSDRVDQGARVVGASKHNHGLRPLYNSVAKWEWRVALCAPHPIPRCLPLLTPTRLVT